MTSIGDERTNSKTFSEDRRSEVGENDKGVVEENVGLALFRSAKFREFKWDEGDEKRVRRRIDLYLMPLLCISYCLQYLDKTTLNYANLFGMKKSLKLNDDQWSWVGSIFYFGYLVGQEPFAYLCQHLHVGKVLAACSIIWGIIIMSTAATHNFAGVMTNRFFLGLIESSLTPGIVLITGMWYTSQEIPSRQLTWYSFQAWAGVFGGLLAYGVGHINGSVPNWAYIFLILGAFTILWGGFLWFVLPDSLVGARFLREEEKFIALARVARNKHGIKNKKFKWYQVQQLFLDPKTYLLFFMSVAAQIPNGIITNFSTVITQAIGDFTILQTTLLGIPSNLIQVVALLLAGWAASHYTNSRVIVMTIGNVACVIASACMAYLPVDNPWGRLVSFWFTPCQSVGFSLSLVMVSSNVAGFTKKTLTAALLFVGYCIGNILGPHFYKSSESPKFNTAVIAMLVSYIVKTVLGVALGLYMWRENVRRDAAQARASSGDDNFKSKAEEDDDGEEQGMLDRTEFENPGFRYVL